MTTVTELYEKALELTPEDQDRLIMLLKDRSSERPLSPEEERDFDDIVKRYEDGTLATIPWETVLDDLKRRHRFGAYSD